MSLAGGGAGDGRRWRDRAACRGIDPEVFFPTAQSGPVLAEQTARATAVCARCPVRAACLEFALRALPEGIAGGTTPDERRALAGRTWWAAAGQRHKGGVDADGGGVGVAARDRAGATVAEVCAAGQAALRDGRPVRAVAFEFGVTERTAYRWARRVRAG